MLVNADTRFSLDFYLSSWCIRSRIPFLLQAISDFFLQGTLLIIKSLYFLIPTIVGILVSASCGNINGLPSTAFKAREASKVVSFASRGSGNMARRTLCRRLEIPETGCGGLRHCRKSAFICEVCLFVLWTLAVMFLQS